MSPATSKSAHIVRQVLVLVAVIATIVFNGLSQAIPIGNQTSADVSNRYPTYFTPANYAFAIWGVIYILMIVYGVYQALPSQRENPRAIKIAWLFILTCILNCVWIVLFQTEQLALSLVVILAFLLTLIAIYLRLDIGKGTASNGDRWCLQLPFSVYLGWVSVATIANVSLLGVAQNWGDLFGIPASTWSAIMLVVATVLGLIMTFTRRDVGYVAVFIWAFVAIINKQAAVPLITTTALIAVNVLLIAAIVSVVMRMRPPQQLRPTGA
ncbi:MAG: tryptophan-rich sensory protein [Anaerolineae bacterium]|nr:tryptophan-rich sensory protein [Anaerolineae bacterium]